MGVLSGRTSPCPRCRANGRDRSGDNLKWYTNDTAHCFACGYNEGDRPKEDEDEEVIEMKDVPKLPMRALTARGISEAAAKAYGVRVEADGSGNDAAYYFPLHDGSGLCGYQRKAARTPGQRGKTDVVRLGETKHAKPFGAHATGSGGRDGRPGGFLIVTEGGEDALAAYDLLAAKGKPYRVVATLGVDGWKKQMQFWGAWEKIVIAFDQDAAGRQAAGEFAAALRPGQGFIARWAGASDPNELLTLADGPDRFMHAVNKAEAFRPDGIIYGEDVWRFMENYVAPKAIPYPEEWSILNQKMGGIREAEITMFTGGSSVGKTAYTRRIKHHILKNTDWKIGEIELEEQKEKTARGLMEAELCKPWAEASMEERRAAYENTYGTNRLFMLNHRSQNNDGRSLTAKFKHLYHAFGCNALFLDHITLAVSEFGDGEGNVAQDQMMNEFLELVETTGVHLFLISHLRKTGSGGKSFEEGAVPSMDDLKGSGSLKQISFNIVGVSRNLQHADDYQRNVSTLHVMKCRETGKTGKADKLYWDNESRSLTVAAEESPPPEGDTPREF
jgi:twinkle protein